VVTPSVAPSDAPLLSDRLLAAACAEFAERGYAGARVAEIARRAGVTTGAIYSRYRGKAELLAAALIDGANDELDALFADHRFEGRMEDILRIAGSHLVDRTDSPAPGMLFEAFAAARHEPDVAELLRAGMAERRRQLGEIVEAAKASGGIDRAIDTTALVTFCHAVGLGFLLLEVIDSPLPEHERWEALIARLIAAAAPVDPLVPR
jgi:AcrR family transcriptional regulator